jgi:DNA-binding beta-propeller fold protein YncE
MAGILQGFIASLNGSIPWLVSAARYLGINFSVLSEEAAPEGLAFKTDGTAMYVVGSVSDAVHQYTLSTAWDLSTASYASKSASTASQTSSPAGVEFSSDGTKMYVLGFNTRVAYQYSLGTPWDIATASYSSLSLSVSTQAASPLGLRLKSDGTAAYVVDIANDAIYQYTLSSAWDISSGSYASKSLAVGSQASQPSGLFFKPDGTKVYVICSTTDSVYQYSLSVAWDISTGSYDSVSRSINTQDGFSSDVVFNSAGERMYVLGDATDKVFEYSL